jgi:hypothetical protein
MNSKLVGSAPTLDKLVEGISDYLMGSTISVEQISERPEIYSVSNANGLMPYYRVIKKGQRYRFERIS